MPLWMVRQAKLPGQPPALTQEIVATGAFAVWVFAIGGLFARYNFYHPVYGTLLLIAYTTTAAIVRPPGER